MQITEIYYQRNFQVGDFLYEHYGVRINVSGTDNIDDAYTEADKIVREQHYHKNKENSFYANPKSDEDLPIVQVKEPLFDTTAPTEEDIIKEMQTYKLGINAFIAVYGKQVLGNQKLEEEYNKKIAELSK
jgi:hypothetical protein